MIHSFNKLEGNNIYSAYTVAELGDIIPAGILSYKEWKKNSDMYGKWGGAWRDDMQEKMSGFTASSDTEADARAKILIHIIENGLMVEE